MNHIKIYSARSSFTAIRSANHSPISILRTPKHSSSTERKKVHFSITDDDSSNSRVQTPVFKEAKKGVQQQEFFETPHHRRSKSGTESIEECKILSREVSFENPKHVSIGSLIETLNKRRQLLAQASSQRRKDRKSRRVRSNFGLSVQEPISQPRFFNPTPENSQRKRVKKGRKPPIHKKLSLIKN